MSILNICFCLSIAHILADWLQWWSGATDMGREGAWYWAHSLTPVSCDWSVAAPCWALIGPGAGLGVGRRGGGAAAGRRHHAELRLLLLRGGLPRHRHQHRQQCRQPAVSTWLKSCMHIRLFSPRKIKSTDNGNSFLKAWKKHLFRSDRISSVYIVSK